ncbi:low specificity L-threonine aldolase [Haladaptatus sp. DJG-WS-42]|uniref:threonine aldolase family protein n=1 Tax=Haladaptatus sp. DJG-WS-42 TaxID=3120516 RepID=UPI0030CBCE4F
MLDLRSDTVTLPDDAMREAAAEATVGDDVYGEDPTVNDLEARAAEIVGKEAALFVPSGTMGNQIAAKVHTNPGHEVLVERESHIYKWELGGLAHHSQLQVRTIDGGDRGVLTPEAIRENAVEESDHEAGTGLVCVENTHNAKGGVVVSPAEMDAAAEAANDLGVPLHVDGARIFNAAATADVPASRLVAEADSVMFCLSKGLGAPVGSMLAGSEAFIDAAHRVRKLMGGGMRQAGMIAAPGLLALENRSRLADDHENAKRLAAGLRDHGLTVKEPETNIVLVETGSQSTDEFLEACEEQGVLGVPFADGVVRFCTHWNVSADDVETVIDAVGKTR